MLNKEEIERVNKILSCDNCPASYACEGCDITWTDKNLIKKYISELEQSNEELDKENDRLEKIEFERDMLKKGQNSLMGSRKKWKHRYYKQRKKLKKQNKIIDEIAVTLAGLALWDNEKEETIILWDKEEVKQYFEKKVEGKNE